MDQEKLETKALQLFEQQGFEIEKKDEPAFLLSNEDTELEIRVLSSECIEPEEVSKIVESGEKVFVDEELSDIKEEISNEVSVIEEDDGGNLNVPSYERIGDIVVISELDGISEEEAVEAVLEHNPGLDSILLKEENLSGEFRIGGYRKLYGDKTETVHREHGVRLKVDPTKMFFSEREGTERKRIFESIDEGDEVLVMFAGAGPFPITIGKNSEASRIVGVEKNSEAVSFARDNLELNGLEDKVEMIQGDVRDICPDLGVFDHVLMPSPTNSLEFISDALSCVKPGGRLVVYSVSEKDDLYSPVIERVQGAASDQDRDIEVLEKRVTADFSPSKRKVAVEFRLE